MRSCYVTFRELSGNFPAFPGSNMSPHPSRRAVRRASAAAAAAAALLAGSVIPAASASASTAAPASSAASRAISPGTRFFVPPPSSGAPQQVISLLKARDVKDAALITEMETIPRAVWFTSGTPAQVKQQAQQTMGEAAIERAVPVLVAYDIPGRDCAQFSAGGALNTADYEAWITGL